MTDLTGAPVLSLAVRQEHDVVLARQRAKQIAELLEFAVQDQTRIATAVSELARNAVRYAGAGKAEFFYTDQAQGGHAGALVVRISDSGSGIANLDEILAGQYVSETGMGLGVVGARRLMDSFEIESTPEAGTTIVVSKRRSPGSSRVGSGRLEQISAELVKLSIQTPLDEVQQQNQELIRALDALESNRQELIRLNNELVDTNRGIVALYAELDEKAQALHRADKVKSRFLAHMSHEFRTPLNSIIALSRLLSSEADGQLSKEQAKQVSFVRTAASELLELVDGLLDLAKVEAGTMSIRLDSCTISDIFSTLRGMFLPLHTNPRVSLVFEETRGLPPLYSDKAKITQILRNFIANALKFTEEGEVRVSASLVDEGASVLFTVADTGVGIAEEDRERVFEEFAQLSNRLPNAGPGSGLGLTISRKLAELLDGAVMVESEVGLGSAFHFKLPLVRASSIGGPGDKLLLIDDSDVDRYLLRGLLEGTGFEILEAASAAEGLRLAELEKPTAIFLDLVMPDRSGTEVLGQLRDNRTTREIPVVVVTSQPLDDEQERLLSSLEALHLGKEIYSASGGAGVVKRVLLGLLGEKRREGDAGPNG